MTALIADRIMRLLWGAFGIYWIATALVQKSSHSGTETQPSEIKCSNARFIRIIHHALLAIAFILLFMRRTAVGLLGERFLPASGWISYLGLVLTVAGLGLAVWARLHLAENWSARVRIRVGHELIRSGPYAHLRHPIYSGVLLGVIGTAIVIGQWRAAASVLIVFISYSIKGRREDRVLEREFGDTWLEHRRHAGFLLPRF